MRADHPPTPFPTGGPDAIPLPGGSGLLALAMLSALAAPPVQAQVGGDEPGMGPGGTVQQLREVVVTGRRSLEERFAATGSMVMVDRQDIERMGVDSTADVLRQLPGLQVNTTANGGVEIRMRGLDSRATRVLIDGQRAAGRGQMPIDQLPADLIERIEILRSPSAEHSGSSGGTVNIVLRQAHTQRSTTIRLTDVVAWDQHRGRLWASRTGPLGNSDPEDKSTQPWSSFTGLWLADNLLGADVAREQFTDGSLSRRTESQSRIQRQDWWLTQRINGRIGRDQLALRAAISGQEGKGRYETTSSTVTELESSTQQRQAWQLGSDWTRRVSVGKLETSLSGSSQDDEQRRQSPMVNFSEDRQESTWQLKSKLTGARESLLWMAGVEYENRRGSGTSLDSRIGNPEQLSSRIERAALWGQNEWELPLKTTLTLGLRTESVQLRSAIDTTRASQRLNFWQPSLHTRTPLGEDAQVRVNIARLTRQPTVWDLLDRSVPSQGINSINNPDQIGNADLRPEVTNTLDLGWEKRLAGQGQLGLSVFARLVDDVLANQVSLADGRWVEQRQNIGRARTVGLEADIKRPLASQGWSRDWTLSATGTLLQSRLSSGPREGQAIPGQARYTANLGLNKPMRRGGGFFGGTSLNLTGPSALGTDLVKGRERSRVVLDAHVGQVISGLGFWRLGLYNLGDTPQRRHRQHENGGQQISDHTTLHFGPRLFIALGTQF